MGMAVERLAGMEADFFEDRRRRRGLSRVDQNGEEAQQRQGISECFTDAAHHARLARKADGNIGTGFDGGFMERGIIQRDMIEPRYEPEPRRRIR